MTGRRRVTLTVSGTIVVIRGRRVRELLLGGGFRSTYSGSAGGHMVDAWRLPDVLAYLESRHIGYTVDDGDDLGGGAA